MTTSSIVPSELQKRLRGKNKVNIIDVRTPAEFREVHLKEACNIPLHELVPEMLRKRYADEPLFLICQKGTRGRQACERLSAAGLANVANVEGGTEACVAAGLPVERGQPVMSLERQVRIAAGSIVLSGIVLGWQVHPAFFGLSAFVGAGLVFSGITATYGMRLVLARMPWNQYKAYATCTSANALNCKPSDE
jgi:rhodanese-related sulfurtransferase